MPVVIKTNEMNYKDSNGEYKGINGISERTTAQQIAEINAAAAAAEASISPELNDLIIISDDQPDPSTRNKLWIENEGEVEYQVPTYEEFEAVRSAFMDDYAQELVDYEITYGSAWSSYNGTVLANKPKVARTTDKINRKGTCDYIKITNPAYLLGIVYYDANETYISGMVAGTETMYPIISEKFALNIQKADNSNIASSDIPLIKAALVTNVPTDKTLTKENKPADAKITGDRLAKSISVDYNYAQNIPANDDLNNYFSSGSYLISSASNATSISNTPETTAGLLIVAQLQSNISMQTYYGLFNIYRRYYTTAVGWSEWTTDVLSKQIPIDSDKNYYIIRNHFRNGKFKSGTGVDTSDNANAVHIEKLNNGTVVFYDSSSYEATYMVVDEETETTLLVPNTGWNTTGKMTIDTNGLVDYTVIVQLHIKSPRTRIEITEIDANTSILQRKKEVDLFLFIGQSNMAGRGVTNGTWTESYPSLIPCAGLEFRAITDQTRLYPISEPFGITQNKSGAINDGNKKTGDMVIAFANAYFEKTGMQIVGVSASEGGTSIDQWAHGSARLNDAIDRFEDAATFLNTNGFTIRHKFMMWCQGESDTRAEITAQQHKTYFDGILADLLDIGIEKCFMCRIGEYNGSGYDYSQIINIQTQIAQENPDVVMATTTLASFKERGLMKDEYHFYQAGYNELGRYAGINVAEYVNTGKEPTMYDPKNDNLYFCHKN